MQTTDEPIVSILLKAFFKISVQNMTDIFKKQDVLLPGTVRYESQKVATFLPVLTPAVTRDYRAELHPITLTVLKLQSDSYIYGRMICHSSVNFTTVMFTPSDRKNGLSYLTSAFYEVKL
jgi:hypothetical protein